MPGSPVTGSKSSPVNLRTESFVASGHLFVSHLMLECAFKAKRSATLPVACWRQ